MPSSEKLPMPALEYLRECFELDPACPSGLRWKKRPPEHFATPSAMAMNSSRAGKPAGSPSGNERGLYYKVYLSGRRYGTHRIVYLMHHGENIDNIIIDHIDRNPANNKIENLRIANTSQNAWNARLSKRNTSGTRGVSWDKPERKWRVEIMVCGNAIHLGKYRDINDAIKARRDAEDKYFGEFSGREIAGNTETPEPISQKPCEAC